MSTSTREVPGVAEQNALLQQGARALVQADIFHWLRDVAATRRDLYDVVILDPAKMTTRPRAGDSGAGRNTST